MMTTATSPAATTLSPSALDDPTSPPSRGFLFRAPSFSRCGARVGAGNDYNHGAEQGSSSSSITLTGRDTPTGTDVVSTASTSRRKACAARQADRSEAIAPGYGSPSNGKDALCRRMGALFLRHKVDQLAGDVEKMQQSQQQRRAHCPVQRRVRQYKERNASSTSLTSGTNESNTTLTSSMHDGAESSRSSGEHSERKAAVVTAASSLSTRFCSGRTWSKSSSAPVTAMASRTDGTLEQSISAPHTVNASPTSTTASRIIVADVSLLIYSLRTVHQWLKAGDCRVVVPCEALSTLDVLKKGEHFLNLAARRATRFLDERFACVSSSNTASPASGAGALKSGLFPQGINERLDLTATATAAAEAEDALVEAGISASALSQAPLPVIKTLACALFFECNYGHRTDVSCSLAIALPPPHLDFDETTAANDSDSGSGPVDSKIGELRGKLSAPSADVRYAERADGNHILHWSKVCGLYNADGPSSAAAVSPSLPRLIVAPTAASWLAAGPQAPSAAATPIDDHRRHGHDHHHHHHHHLHQHQHPLQHHHLPQHKHHHQHRH